MELIASAPRLALSLTFANGRFFLCMDKTNFTLRNRIGGMKQKNPNSSSNTSRSSMPAIKMTSGCESVAN